jgi:hypothetical protein
MSGEIGRASVGALPNFFIVGAARGGTTALADILGQHPSIFVTRPKEPHFLAFAGCPMTFSGPGDDITINKTSVTDPSRYLALYEGAGGKAARGDASVSSLYYAEETLANLDRFFPEARVIAILREPIGRAFSAYSYQRGMGFEPCDEFGVALQQESERIRLGWHHLWHYVSMSRYVGQLEKFVDALGPRRIQILFYENLQEDPHSVARHAYEFLGVDSAVRVEPRWFNASGRPRSKSLHSAITWATRRPRIRASVRTLTPFRMRERIRRANLERMEMPHELQEDLKVQFAPEVEGLRALLQRSFPEVMTATPPWLRGQPVSAEGVR